MSKVVIGFGLDLIFSSKVREACEQGALAYKGLKRVEGLDSVDLTQVALVILNLEADSQALCELVPKLKSSRPELPIMGFCSHINAEAFQLAETLGLPQAMPKSQFVKVLPEFIASL